MFAELPKHLQDQVVYYLQTGNFIKAKHIHDSWIATNESITSRARDMGNNGMDMLTEAA